MSITFAVDDVALVDSALERAPLRVAATRLLGAEAHVTSHESSLVDEPQRTNQLVACVHRAFGQHRPLALSPDHIWLAIAQGFASHVDLNAEQLRDRFVRHDGRAQLSVETESFPTSAAAWAGAISKWSARIADHVGPGLMRLLECEFSTTTDVERTAARINAMSAFKRYFTYELVGICGIPSVTLEGSVEDWKSLRRRLDVLEEYDLKWWVRELRPVADQLVATAEGRPDQDFWRSIYKPAEAYGGTVATGWFMRLFPYLGSERSPAAQKGKHRGVRENPWVGPGVATSEVPLGLNSAPITLKSGPSQRKLYCFSGFVGYRQLPGGALRPEIAWAVAEPPPSTSAIDEILSRPECVAAPATALEASSTVDPSQRINIVPGELVELYDRCDGFVCSGLEVFPRARLRPVLHREQLGELSVLAQYGVTFGSLHAQPLSYVRGASRSLPVVVFEGDAKGWEPEDIPVVAESIGEFLAAFAAQNPIGPICALYDRLPEDSPLVRRALRTPGLDPTPSLSRREVKTLILKIRDGEGTAAQQDFWWRALVATLELKQPREAYFAVRKSLSEIAELMGLE